MSIACSPGSIVVSTTMSCSTCPTASLSAIGWPCPRDADGAGRELEVRLGPLVDSGDAGAFSAVRCDETWLPARVVAQDTLGVQRVATEVHQGPSGQVE